MVILDRRYTPILRFSMADASRTEKSLKKKKKKMHHVPLCPEGSALIRLRVTCSTITLIFPVNSFESEVILVSYEIVPKRGYFELWVDGEFAGNYDTREEAEAEMTAA